jgi:predicted ATPase
MALVVITGAPGAGKTTLLQALSARGCTIVDDTARGIIRDRRERGLNPRPEPDEFRRQILEIEIENYERHAAGSRPVFFERGVVDALSPALGERELERLLATYRYFPKVFVLPPWRAIYVTDAERDHTFEHAQWVDRVTRKWYRRCGYQIVEVPIGTVDERCEFVLRECARGAD